MSKTDDRIIRMGFDNSKFESNAAKTMTTLDKLNEKLKLKGAAEGGDNVQKSIDSVNFASMERAILSIEKRFSTLGVVGMNVIGQITNGIVGSVKQLEAATIGQIKSGGWSRAMNIANAKFQIEGLGFAWEEVEKAVSYGVKDTAYGLDAAASAASQLAASGVDFKKTLDTVNGQDLTAMHKSLRAISGVAAMTNSSYEDIARIFTTVAGNGRLMGDQLLQLSSRGMNAAAKLAEVLNTSEEEVRNMVSRGKIDFQTFAFAMDDAFGAHAKEANKTFTGSLGNMKAALSRVGEIFASPVINKTNTLFISLTERIDEFKNKLKSIKVPRTLDEIKKQYDGITLSATAYDQMLKNMEGRTVTFGEHFATMWQSGIDAFSNMIKSVDIGWFDKIVEKVDSVTVKITEFFDLIKEIYGESAEEAAESVNDATQTLLVSAEEAQAAKDILIKGMYGGGAERKANLIELFGGGEIGEQHAKNVQAYIDSVLAAQGDYTKATIQVAEANEEVAKSQTDVAREVRKAKIKSIIDDVTGSFLNLWTVAKNVGKSVKKIAMSIITAFSSVFNLNLGSISDGAFSLTESLVELSEKLVISDETASKITVVFTKLFTTIKNGAATFQNGAKKAGEFIKKIGDSKSIQTIKNKLIELYGKVKEFSNGNLISSIKSKVTEFFNSFSLDGVEKTITDLFSRISESFKGIDLPKSIKDNEFIASLSDFIDEMKVILADDSDVPTKIGNLLNKIIEVIKNTDVIDVGKTAVTVWGIVSIARIFFALNDIGKMIESVTDIPEKVGGMISSIGKMFKNFGIAAENVSKVAVIKATATAILELAGTLMVISQIPADDVYRATSVLVVIVGSLAFLSSTLNKTAALGTGIKATLISITAFSANIIAVATLIAAIGGAVMLIAAAFATVNNTISANGDVGSEKFTEIMGVLMLVLGAFIILGAALKKEYVAAESLLPTFVGMAAIIASFGSAMLAVSAAMYIIGMIPTTGFEHAIVATALVGSVMVLLLAMSAIAAPTQMIGAAIAMVGIAGALNLLALAIGAISLLPQNDSVIDAVKSLVGIAVVMFLGVAVISKVMTSNITNILGIIVGVLAIQLVIGAIVAALMALTAVAAESPEALAQASKTIAVMALVVGLIAALLGIGAAISSQKSGGDNDALFAVGAAFVMIAGGIYILAAAMEKIASVASGPGFAAAIIVMISFIAVVAGLAIAATVFPAMIPALDAVGKAMLMAGAGFALVGAGIFLVCKGIAILAPSIAILAINLEALFTVIENHLPATIVILVAAVVVIGLIAWSITKLAPVITAIANVISNVASKIGNTVSNGTSKLKNWVSNLSTKGKTAIVAVITTLCAAILKASPQLLETVGKLLIKLLAYLGKIAGDLALGLVDFLINLINGLADAIRLNSNRIAAAIWNVVFSLVSLVISVVNELIHMLLGDELGGLVDDLFNFSELDSMINQTIVERRKIAEEADQAKKDYQESILGVAESTEESKDRVDTALGGMSDFLKQKSGEQKSELQSLKEEYADLPGYAYDAILRSKNPEMFRESGGMDASAYTNGFESSFGGGGGSWGVEDELGHGLTTQNYEDYGAQNGTTYTTAEAMAISDGSDEIYDATKENTDSAQQAIIDSKEDTKASVQENFNDPFQLQIRSGRANSEMAVEYVVAGMIQAMEDKKGSYAAAAVRLAKAGNDAFEAENDIDSPSKLYYQNGEYIVQGLINGIEKNTDNAASTMGSLSDAILNSFGNPIDYLSKISTGELVYDPSIRPVFDGSRLYKGASSINSMLNQQTISVSGMSGKLAADMGTLDKGNVEIVNELRALREDMSMMQDAMENMQIVMDTGALVGSTVGAYDAALGKRQFYRGRGN